MCVYQESTPGALRVMQESENIRNRHEYQFLYQGQIHKQTDKSTLLRTCLTFAGQTPLLLKISHLPQHKSHIPPHDKPHVLLHNKLHIHLSPKTQILGQVVYDLVTYPQPLTHNQHVPLTSYPPDLKDPHPYLSLLRPLTPHHLSPNHLNQFLSHPHLELCL